MHAKVLLIRSDVDHVSSFHKECGNAMVYPVFRIWKSVVNKSEDIQQAHLHFSRCLQYIVLKSYQSKHLNSDYSDVLVLIFRQIDSSLSLLYHYKPLRSHNARAFYVPHPVILPGIKEGSRRKYLKNIILI